MISDWCINTHNHGLHSLLGRCYVGLSHNLPHPQTPAERGRLCDEPSKEILHRRLCPELLHGVPHKSTRLPLMFDSPTLRKYGKILVSMHRFSYVYCTGEKPRNCTFRIGGNKENPPLRTTEKFTYVPDIRLPLPFTC